MPKGVYIHIPHKGMFQKGQPSPNKGKHHSPETIEKIRQSNLGQKRSEETCLKIGLSKKGIVSPLKGKKHSKKQIEKNRLSHIGLKQSLETRKKKSLIMLGENNHKYIKDRTKLKISDRHQEDVQYIYWARQIKNRDNWKCKINNKECNGRLEAHHILSWREHKELRYDISNGITLCHYHHPRKHSEEKRLSKYFKKLIA